MNQTPDYKPPSRSGSGTFARTNPKMQHLRPPSARASPYGSPIGSPSKQKINAAAQDTDKSDNSERKRVFKKDIVQMMRGFGGETKPYRQSAELINDIMENFIADMTRR